MVDGSGSSKRNVRETRNCKTCGKPFEPIRSTAKYCSDSCRYHEFLTTKKRILIPNDLRFSILQRDGFRCVYCGDTPDKKQLRVDHIVSLEDGGHRTDPNNLVTTCNPCNAGKGSASVQPEEVPWVGFKEDVQEKVIEATDLDTLLKRGPRRG